MLEADSTFEKVSWKGEEIPKYKVFTLTSYADVLYQELEFSALAHTRQFSDHCNDSYTNSLSDHTASSLALL